jgi:CMP-N,N'-diacetyllegionaminic acid synthase
MTSSTPVCLAVIPARGGSKGIKEKNIRPFAGRSLLSITIDVANRAKRVTDVIVSSDSPKIMEAAAAAGGKAPFVRPAELSRDDVPVWEVARHAGEWFARQTGAPPDMVMSLQPTSPLRQPKHLDTAIEKLANSDADAIMTVTEAEHSPYKMRTISEGYLYDFLPGKTVGQRQDAPPVYRLNGVAYVTRWQALLDTKSLWGRRTLAYVLPEHVALNIDSMLEFEIAEFLYRRDVSQ